MGEITQLLKQIDTGSEDAKERLFCRLYDDLKALASRRLLHEDQGHTLQPTALVNETYLRLMNVQQNGHYTWNNRRHFFGAAAEAMRRILVESARRKQTQKRGGNLRRQDFNPDTICEPELAEDLIALDEALTRFKRIEPRRAELVSLRFFAGLSLKEAAEQLEISSRTADSDWAYARAWLLAEIAEKTA